MSPGTVKVIPVDSSNSNDATLIKEGLLVYFSPYTNGAGFEEQYNIVVPYNQLREAGVSLLI